MSNVVRQGVEGIGISHDIPTKLCVNSWFTEVAIPETVTIPNVKPDMEELLSVMVEAKIVSLRIINTPEGTSREGQKLTGKKLSIELELNQKVKYIADEPTQSVHSAHFTKKVSSIWIVVPKTVKEITPTGCKDVKIETLLAQGKLLVTPYIEDIYGEQLDKRTIFKNTTLLINVGSTCNYYTFGEANLTFVKEAPEEVKVPSGATSAKFTYTLNIENTGCAVATNVTLNDVASGTPVNYAGNFTLNGFVVPGVNPFPAGSPVDLGDIPPFTTYTVTYDMETTAPGTITNNATLAYKITPCSTTLTTVSDSTSTVVS